ncbi:MAG: hypothetical protein AAFR97_03225 [Bacteroidota bacterium]
MPDWKMISETAIKWWIDGECEIESEDAETAVEVLLKAGVICRDQSDGAVEFTEHGDKLLDDLMNTMPDVFKAVEGSPLETFDGLAEIQAAERFIRVGYKILSLDAIAQIDFDVPELGNPEKRFAEITLSAVETRGGALNAQKIRFPMESDEAKAIAHFFCDPDSGLAVDVVAEYQMLQDADSDPSWPKVGKDEVPAREPLNVLVGKPGDYALYTAHFLGGDPNEFDNWESLETSELCSVPVFFSPIPRIPTA